jgi:beta-N-acetylglucosaminidase
METDASPSRSLAPGSEKYSSYWHASDRRGYDSGFRRASTRAVAHFMDPRNFLGEEDVFQFMDLAYDGRIGPKDVRSVLRGTFMEKLRLENGVSVAEYLVETGRELGVNALHLAARMRQEQGVRAGPLVSGRCGGKLAGYIAGDVQREGRYEVLTPRHWQSYEAMAAYDGDYNFFNIEASGTGRFAIYLGGMKEARKGTPSKAREWGGDGGWNTRWKAIYGGAAKIAGAYVANRQNTLYLQKWNVDARSRTANGMSRNFWGQYMQNIMASRNEARQIYRSLRENDLLALPYRFLVPVYDAMPESPAEEPLVRR